MSKSKLKLVSWTQGEDWNQIVRNSPQGTLFSEKFYLDAAVENYHLYSIQQGKEIKACIALIVSQDGKCVILDDLVIYGGILFNLDLNRQFVKRRHDEFQITEFFINEIVEKYKVIEFQLSPQHNDMRPFLWFKYHEPQERKFSIDLRYTSYVDISSLKDTVGCEETSVCFNNMETVRRYSIREARRKNGSVVRVEDGSTLIEFYRLLMQRQGDEQSSKKLTRMLKVINVLLKEERGAVYHVLNSDGETIYSVVYGWDDKRAYYLFGAGHPELSEPWQGTLAHWEVFKDLAQRLNIAQVDLEGVNSPKRGWFKLGLGGDLRSYYHVVR